MQRSLRSAIEQLGTTDYVYVSISVDSSDTDAALVSYADREGFNWTFAKATPEMLQALIDQFGYSVSNPPISPHIIIGPTGVVSESTITKRSPEELIAEIEAGRSAS